MPYLLFLPALFFFLLPLIGALFSDTGSKGSTGSKKLYDAEDKAGRYGSTSNNPEVVLKHIDSLESAMSSYGHSASSSTMYCCRETMSELNYQYNDLTEGRWEKRAQKYLYSMEADFARLLEGDVSTADIENIRKIKNHALSQYDAYWKWTEQCADQCKTQSAKQNLWNRAKEDFQFRFDDTTINLGITSWWDTSSHYSVRSQIESRLNQRVEELKPEYIRKKKLIKDMLNTVASEETMLRADLMKAQFDGVTKNEVSAIYRLLVKTDRLFEMKVDTRYIVSLSDKEREKRAKRQKTPIKDADAQPAIDA